MPLLIILIFLTPLTLLATVIIDERGSIELEVPANWKYEKNLLGLPHVFLSSTDAHKTSLSVTLTGLADVKLPTKELAKNQRQYQEGRKKWATKRDFTILKFLPYQQLETKSKTIIHKIGFVYKNKDQEFSEMSFYAECPRSLVHVKLLGKKQNEATKIAEQIPLTLQCR